jgi:hypothetical protein
LRFLLVKNTIKNKLKKWLTRKLMRDKISKLTLRNAVNQSITSI